MADGGRTNPNNSHGLGYDYGPRSEAVRRIRRAVGILAIVTAVGTLGHMVVGGWSLLDAPYMTIITIGFEEVRDLDGDPAGRVWTMLLVIGGVGALGYATTSLVALAVEGTVRGYFRKRRMRTEIRKLQGHHILYGYGRVGRQVAREFVLDGVSFVLVDQDPEKVEECLEDGHPALVGEASDAAVLEETGIRRARGLVAAVDSDADNVFVVLSARKMNPSLHIVARSSSDESAAKLEIAGADRTLSPYAVGGRRLASLATQPLIVDFLDIVTRGEKGIEFRLEEFGVPKESALANRTIGELQIGEKTGAIVLATRNEAGRFDTTPSAREGSSRHPHRPRTRGQITRLERRLRLTRRCLETLAEFRNPVAVVTKNHLVTRDADLLSGLARHDAACVAVSLTTLDDELRRVMEPRTSRPARRLAAIQKLARAGIPVGVMTAPVIPGINDHELPALLSAAAQAGASFAGYTPVRLPGAVRPVFEDWLRRNFPDRKEKVLNRIRSMRGGRLNDPRFGARMKGKGVFAEHIAQLFALSCRRAGIREGCFPKLSTAAFRKTGAQPSLFD